MADDRPPDWDWVKATHQCSAQAMFGELKALARRDVQARNAQLGNETFRFTEINGIHFLISKGNNRADVVGFNMTDDLAQISVAPERTQKRTVYTVALDDNGICKFRNDAGQLVDAWQVLKAALEPLLFG